MVYSSLQRQKVSKKNQNRDTSQLSPEVFTRPSCMDRILTRRQELQKRAAQSARDKARIAEAKRVKVGPMFYIVDYWD